MKVKLCWEKWQCVWAQCQSRKSYRWNLLIRLPIRFVEITYSVSTLKVVIRKSKNVSHHIHKLYPKCQNYLKWIEKLEWIYIAQGFLKFFASALPPTFQFPVRELRCFVLPSICPRSSFIMPCSFFLPFPPLFFFSQSFPFPFPFLFLGWFCSIFFLFGQEQNPVDHFTVSLGNSKPRMIPLGLHHFFIPCTRNNFISWRTGVSIQGAAPKFDF